MLVLNRHSGGFPVTVGNFQVNPLLWCTAVKFKSRKYDGV